MDGLDITIADAPGRLAGYHTTPPQRPLRSRLRRNGRLLGFLLVVGLPTLLTALYLVAFAADQYVSEAKFVVRGPASQSPGMLNSLLQTAGMSHAPDDTYAVQDFIVSRDALGEMIHDQGLRDVFNRPEADPLARFPLIASRATFEHFFDYYKSHVDVFLDTTTGVSTLTVKSFRPDDSKRIAAALLTSAENLINRMNERERENAMRDARKEVVLAEQRAQDIGSQIAVFRPDDSKRIAAALLTSAENLINRMNERERENAMRDARKEVVLAEQRAQDIGSQIAVFRNHEALLDPNKQSVPMLQSVNDLQTMLSRANLQLTQLMTSSSHSPLIPDYQHRIVALQTQIDDAKTKITGTDKSLVPKITEYDMLTLQREFAEKQLASAITSLEAARMQSERQQLYLDTIVQPNQADYPAYPKKLASIAIVFGSFLGIYLMASLLIAGAREHKIV